LVLSRVRLIRVKFVLVNLNPINDTYSRWKKMGPETLQFFTLEKHATKSHLPKLIFRAGGSDIGGPERVSAPSNAEMKLHGVSSTGRVLQFVYVFVHAVGGAAPLHSPRKTL